MFGKKAKEIKKLESLLAENNTHFDNFRAEIASLKAANADQAQKLKNAAALLEREQAATAREKKRADENYAQYTAEKARADSLQVPLTIEVSNQATAPAATPKRKK